MVYSSTNTLAKHSAGEPVWRWRGCSAIPLTGNKSAPSGAKPYRAVYSIMAVMGGYRAGAPKKYAWSI